MIDIDSAAYAHYATIAAVMGGTALGAGIGEGLTGRAALEAITIQPSARNDITKTAIFGMALMETAAIFGLTVALMLLSDTSPVNPATGIAKMGIALALSLPGFFIGLVSSFPVIAACLATARQPFFSQKIMRLMLISQAIIQTPIIFGFIIALIIYNQLALISTTQQAITFLASGLSIGLGSIGPCIGLAHFAKTACTSIGINPQSYNTIFSFTFISQAIIETPIIFSLVVSILLAFTTVAPDASPTTSTMLLMAALVMGTGTIGAGISSGRTAAAACEQIALHPEHHAQISRLSMIAQGLIDTCAIYPLLIALLLIFW